MTNLKWIHEIDWRQSLNGDLRDLAEIIGIDNLMKAWLAFSKTHIYFSEQPLNVMKKEYIKKHHKPGNTKELARMLDVSEVFVQQVVSRLKDDNQLELL
jgi:hypothetical protein